MITATRYHDFSCGHRVYGHESKCAHLHGHNYRVHFTVAGTLDRVGRVLDFSAIKDRLCTWVEERWDHRFLIWEHDPWARALQLLNPQGVVVVRWNPTAENMAVALMGLGPELLEGTGVRLVRVTVEETRKCSATAGGDEYGLAPTHTDQ